MSEERSLVEGEEGQATAGNGDGQPSPEAPPEPQSGTIPQTDGRNGDGQGDDPEPATPESDEPS